MGEESLEFEHLKIYQKAMDYVSFVYKVTKAFPATEASSLVDRFKRASMSICVNIAEGSGESKADFSRLLIASRKTLRECIVVTEIAHKQGFLTFEERRQSRHFCFEIASMLTPLIQSLGYTEVTHG